MSKPDMEFVIAGGEAGEPPSFDRLMALHTRLTGKETDPSEVGALRAEWEQIVAAHKAKAAPSA